MANNIALIVAAGKGKRFGGDVPKQYELLHGKPVLAHSVEAFLNHPQIDAVKVVISKEHEELFKSLELQAGYCFGGEERQDSVRMGLEGLDCKNVLIHDAARPYISAEVISNVINALENNDAAIPVISAKDSARYNGEAIDRDKLKFVQTPQGFSYDKIQDAHAKADKIYTDDAQVAEANGVKVAMVEGDLMNIKITDRSDMQTQPTFRIGQGYDVHAFETGTRVTLCGVKVAHTHGLKGHSDADVAMHAITDALLGAVGEGDIGEHFPPSDAQWLNAKSEVFLQKAAALVAAKNGKISNIDLTIICEAPKITPHKKEMQKNIAQILGTPLDAINIKATTTEKLGFTGREEGIAAQAVASVLILS